MLKTFFNKNKDGIMTRILLQEIFFVPILNRRCHLFDIIMEVNWKTKSSRTEFFFKNVVLKNFAKFTGKHLCQSLRPATLLKKRLWYRCFPVSFTKFLRTPFFTEHLCWLLLKNSMLPKHKVWNGESRPQWNNRSSCSLCLKITIFNLLYL